MNDKILNIIDGLNNAARNYNDAEFINDIYKQITKKKESSLSSSEQKEAIIKYLEDYFLKNGLNVLDLYSKLNINYVKYFKNSEYKKMIIDKMYLDQLLDELFVDILCTIDDNEFKKKYFKLLVSSRMAPIYLANLLGTIKDDDYILSNLILLDQDDPDELANALIGITDDEVKLREASKLGDDSYFIKVICSLSSDELKLSYLDKVSKSGKAKIILSLSNLELLFNVLKFNIDSTFKSKYRKFLKRMENDTDIVTLVDTFIPYKLGLMDSIYTLERISNEEIRFLIFKRIASPKLAKASRTRELFSHELLLSNLDYFLGIELNDKEKGIKYSKYIMEMYKSNSNILNSLNVSLLDSKYLDTLGLDKINMIGNFKDVTDLLLKLNDKEYQVFYLVFKYYISVNSDVDWTYVIYKLLTEIKYSNSSCTLINRIDDISKYDIAKLSKILVTGNFLKLDNPEDINRYNELIKDKCMSYRNSKDEHLIKDAISIKMSGIFSDFNLLRNFQELVGRNMFNLVSLYGDDIEKTEHTYFTDFVRYFKKIIDIHDIDELERIYDSIDSYSYIDIFRMEKELKKSYLKLYNATLLQVNGSGVIEAPDEFSIITTSIGAYVENDIDDYNRDWNRASNSSIHFCTNYIRNDMLGTAPINDVCYGFNEMGVNSLMLSGPTDIYSTGESFISKAYMDELYVAPDTLINKTYKSNFKYNEMDFARVQNGVRKQPDYIIVYRRNGIIPNMEKAKKASSDFGNLPILVIDVDRCLSKEKDKVSEMLTLYQSNPTEELKNAIITKIRNNRVTDSSFLSNIDLDMYFNQSEDVKKGISLN